MTGGGAELTHVVLDLDDTLIATRAACRDASSKALATLGIAPPEDSLFLGNYGRLPFRACFLRWGGNEVDYDRFVELYEQQVTYASIGDAISLLCALTHTGYQLGLITNSTQAEAERKLDNARIPAQVFDPFVAAPTARREPTDHKPFRAILDAHGLRAPSTLYISDSAFDGQGAIAAGMPFRGVLSGIHAVADFVRQGTPALYLYPDVHAATADLIGHADEESLAQRASLRNFTSLT